MGRTELENHLSKFSPAIDLFLVYLAKFIKGWGRTQKPQMVRRNTLYVDFLAAVGIRAVWLKIQEVLEQAGYIDHLLTEIAKLNAAMLRDAYGVDEVIN